MLTKYDGRYATLGIIARILGAPRYPDDWTSQQVEASSGLWLMAHADELEPRFFKLVGYAVAPVVTPSDIVNQDGTVSVEHMTIDGGDRMPGVQLMVFCGIGSISFWTEDRVVDVRVFEGTAMLERKDLLRRVADELRPGAVDMSKAASA
jgi:hypothetical protein